jgi:hypothetical protein
MRIHIPCTALGLALAVVAPAAHAETIVTRQIVSQPVETVRTVTTTRTVRPIIRRRVVVTRRTTVSEYVAPVAPVAPRPVYDVVAPAPAVAAPYPRPVYDVVTPAPAVAAPVVDETVVAPGAAVAPVAVGTAVPAYRYVYQPDRILVIDPATGIAVQALPR